MLSKLQSECKVDVNMFLLDNRLDILSKKLSPILPLNNPCI